MPTKRAFDLVVMTVFLTTIAINGVGKAWARRHLAEGHPGGVGNTVAGAMELAA